MDKTLCLTKPDYPNELFNSMEMGLKDLSQAWNGVWFAYGSPLSTKGSRFITNDIIV